MIPFVDLAAQQDRLRTEIEAGIAGVLAHGKYILGPEVDELEERLSAFSGAAHAITVANGTDALQIALMALGIGPGDEVITPGFSYIAAAEAVAVLGAKVVYVDIDPASYNLDPALLDAAITPRTKAIIPDSRKALGRPIGARALATSPPSPPPVSFRQSRWVAMATAGPSSPPTPSLPRRCARSRAMGRKAAITMSALA